MKTENDNAGFGLKKVDKKAFAIACNSLIMGHKPLGPECAVRPNGALRQAADLIRRCGETMSIKRTAIVPAILALSTAGSILAGTTATVLATSVPATAAVAAAAKPAHIYEG